MGIIDTSLGSTRFMSNDANGKVSAYVDYCARARLYDADRRFVAADPARGSAPEVRAFNSCVYRFDNPCC